ncbi:MAG: OmpA family protein [Myxococcales bacterium]|nr:OmpA family protein [Myxococcales bacterium]MCB9550860.1 OmpA family protein [Myxococcales bacterium]
MAKLTPAGKGLITVTILAVTAAAVWHLGLGEMITGGEDTPPSDGKMAEKETPAAATGDAPKPSAGGEEPAEAPRAAASGALGSAQNPLKVSIVSFHGYAPALVANGNSLRTKPGSIYAKQGVDVEFVIQDDIPTLATIFTSKTAHCAWRTSDFWAQEQPNLRNAGLDGRAVMVVDNTQGGDAVIARDPAIQRIEDLAGRSVALLQFTPSHGMLIDAIENSSLSARKKQSVKMVYVNVDEGTAGVRAALEGGHVDAAALWDPDLALALKKVPGAHVIYSTKTATNLIYDVMVCDARVLDDPKNERAIQGFVAGWMAGVDAARANPDNAVDALVQTEEFFTLLAKEEGRDFVRGLFQNVVWTGVADNARILGMSGGTNHYERVYKRFDGIYRAAGALANPNSPVINPADSFDYRFIQKLVAADAAAQEKAKEPEFTFTEKQREETTTQKEATVTKPVTVNFTTGSAELSKRSQRTIDEEMVPLIESNGSAYFEVSGNTDSTGSRKVNQRLSEQRAEGVVEYLVKQWEFPRERFKVVGYGPDKPICNEKNPGEEGVDLEACRAMNRATRLAVFAR